MINNCYIDNVNIAERFGIFVLKGSYGDLLSFPSMRMPDYVSWPEEDGIDADLSNPVIESKDIDMSFFARDIAMMSDFKLFLSSPGMHVLRIPSLQRSWNIRMSDNPDNTIMGISSTFKMKFVEDKPVRPTAIDLPNPGVMIRDSGYELDGISLADYGLIVLKGIGNILREPTAKINLNRKIQTLDGQIYDSGALFFAHKEVTFKCLLKASSMENMWNCYDSLLMALIQPEERLLYVDATGDEYPCFYKQTSSFVPYLKQNVIYFSFDLTLVFTSFRVNGTEYLLSSEAGDLIETEDEQNLIDLDYGNN